ncbi:MAG: (d)CMP kinase [Bacilli bacterium]|nr:(d)CMP kinase [Bacilli bacterium]
MTVIAIDGPAGSGKGTLAKAISEKLGYLNIDTGATYRCLALASIRNNLTINDTKELVDLAKKIDIKLTRDGKVFLDNEDVTKLIRSKEVTAIVSQISSAKEIREVMVDIQRKCSMNDSVVIEGRDITTVVFPDATYKFYLDASLEERANRRFQENKQKNIDMTYDEIYENIKMRDYNDMHKEVGSLMRTDDQIYIDSTNMTIEEVINMVLNIVRNDDK